MWGGNITGREMTTAKTKVSETVGGESVFSGDSVAREEGSLRRPPQGVFAAPLWASATICLLPVCSACLLPTYLLLSQLKVQQRSLITSALVMKRAWTNLKLIGEPCNGTDIRHWIPLLTHRSTEYPPGHLGLMWDADLCFRSAAFWAFSVGICLLGRFPAALRFLLTQTWNRSNICMPTCTRAVCQGHVCLRAAR